MGKFLFYFSSRSLSWPSTHYVANDYSLEFLILLPLPPNCCYVLCVTKASSRN